MRKIVWTNTFWGFCIRIIYRIFWIKIKYIPNDEILWRAVYNEKQVKKDGTLKPAFFRDKNGLSCDLARFSTIEKSRMGHKKPPRWGLHSGLVELDVSTLREIGADVQHKPIKKKRENNYAHCQFSSFLATDLARKLIDNSRIIIKPTFSQESDK